MFSSVRPMLVLTLPLFLLSQATSGSRTDVSPVEQVVKLLTELKLKITKEGVEEKKLFDAFMAWCKDGGKEKEFEITTSKSKIEDLEATISKGASDIEVSTSKIEELAAQLSTNDADLQAATGIREKAHTEFVALEKELIDTIDTLERAINILARKLRGSALMQAKVDSTDVKNLISTLSTVIDAASLSLHDRTKLLGLVQSSDEDEDAAYGAPSPEAYASHSEGIIDVLEDLKQKATTQLEQARREEVTDKHNFDLLKQSLSDQIKVDSGELSSSKQAKHDATETVAGAQGDLEEEKKLLAEAETTLANMEGDCKQRAADNAESVAKRAAELEAVEKARQVIQESVGGAAKITYGESFLQVSAVNSLGNALGSKLRTRADLANFEVVNLIRKLAHEQRSAMLQQLATRISTAIKNSATHGEDPFAKVKGMISDMIEKLLKDAGEEAQHKAYCDKEMAETKQKTDELEYDVEKYSSKLDKARAASVMLKDEVSVLQNEILEITKSQSEADDLRKEELKVYTQSKSDLEQGIEGVRLAMKMLRDFYAEQPAAMIQQPARADAAGGIVAMLEVVEADMGKSLATIEMNEETAATQYERTKMQNKIDKKMKESDVKYKTKEAATLDKKATDLASDLDSTQAELDAVLSYTKNIRGMCSTKPEGYEERKVRREQEIEGLKEALRILEGEAVFLQGRSKSSRLRGIMASARPHAQQ
mmetsp:Transcript_130870/g.231306  ORF Transcript_130870/g.231306 Transcript_130870/m.231306 type:complete len:711 (-) Transcript_130870:68-2200(-)